MRALRYITGFLALAVLLVLAGCGGTSAGVDPRVSFNFFGGNTGIPNVSAEQPIQIDTTVDLVMGDQVISTQWTEVEQPGGGTIGIFSSPTSASTNWTVLNPAAITENTTVTLLLTVKTLKGGETVTPINLIVHPTVQPVP